MSRANDLREILLAVRTIARRVTKLEQRMDELEEFAAGEPDDDDDHQDDGEE